MEEENAESLLFLRSSKAWFPSTASFTVNGFASSQCCELESLATFCEDSHGKPFLSYSVPPLVCQVRAGVTGALHAGSPLQQPGSCSQLLILLRLPPAAVTACFKVKMYPSDISLRVVLAPQPPTEAGRRHCFPLVWILSKSRLSSSKFKEKSDSVGVVPVHVSPAVSNLCVGHTRRRCAVIFRSSVAWFPACCLPQQHSLVLGDQSSPRAPGHEVSVQYSICQSQMQYCWFTCHA